MTPIIAKIWKFLRLPTNLQLFIMRKVNDQFLVGVTGIIFNDNNEVLIFKHSYRDKDHWSLPGGYIKGKEHPKEGLEREIKEESGLIVSVDEKLKLRTDRNSSRIDLTYTATFIGGDFKPSVEVKEAGFFSFDNLPDILTDQLFFIDKAIKERVRR